MTNLSLDLYQINCHAQEYMRSIGISYEHATPQTITDSWWFWNCSNVPDPLPPALRILKTTPSEAVGYGLSSFDAKRLERSTATDYRALCAELADSLTKFVDSDGDASYVSEDEKESQEHIESARSLLAHARTALAQSDLPDSPTT